MPEKIIPYPQQKIAQNQDDVKLPIKIHVKEWGSTISFPSDSTKSEIESFLNDNEHALNPNYKPPEGFSGLAKNVLTGAQQTGRMVGATIDTLKNNLTGVEDYAKESQISAQRNMPVEQRKLMGELSDIDRAQGAFTQLGDALKVAARNPMGTGQFIVEQSPNTAVSLGAGYAGFKTGAAAGSFVGPMGAAIGGTLGFLGGMFLGNFLLEAGGKAIEKASDADGFTPQDKDAAITEGLKKSFVITGVDAATLKLGGVITRKLGSPAIKAGAKAEATVLMNAGVDMSSPATINAAIKKSPDLFRAAKVAGERASLQSLSRTQKAGILGTGIALETVSEGTGDYAGEYLATGKPDVVDSAMEALAGLTQSSIEAAYNFNKLKSGNDLSPKGIHEAASSINEHDLKEGINKINKASSVDEAINAAADVVSKKPVTKDDVLRSVDPTLADIERLTGLKPTEAIDQAINETTQAVEQTQPSSILPQGAIPQPLQGKSNEEKIIQKTSSAPQNTRILGNKTEIVLPDNTTLSAQWDIVDADTISATIKEGINQPRDRTRAASDLQIQSIASNPDYRRLSDSPVLDFGAPTLSSDGLIVGGNARFAGASRAYEQGTATEYFNNLKADAKNKGIDPSAIDAMSRPVLVRRVTQPFDARKISIASNSGASLQYSGLELAKIDADRMTGIEDIDITDSGDVALTPNNITRLKQSLSGYNQAEIASLVDSNGSLSQDGVRRVRNAILAKAYGNSGTLSRMVESTDADMRNVLGALTRSAGIVAKVRSDIKSGAIPEGADLTKNLLGAVETFSQIRAKNQPLDQYLAQKNLFGENLDSDSQEILKFLHDNVRSQKKLTEFIKGVYDQISRIDQSTEDIFGDNAVPSKTEVIRNAKQSIAGQPGQQQEIFAKQSGGETIKSNEQQSATKADNAGSGKEGEPKFSRSPEERLKDRERSRQLERLLRADGHAFTITPKDMRDFALNDRSKKNEADTAEKLARIFGRRIVWIDAKGDDEINGVIIPNIKDTIFIDVGTEKYVHAVMGHEFSHHFQHDNPAGYKDLVKALETLIRDHKGYAKSYKIAGASKQAITREIVGDLFGDNFTKPEFWNKVAEYNPNAFRKIADAVISWLKKLVTNSKMRGLGSERWVTDAQKAQDIIAQALSKYAVKDDAAISSGKPKFSKAYHGSPHDHNKFDSSKIGTGEGAQTYGSGHYFNDGKEVAEYYSKYLSGSLDTGNPELDTQIHVSGGDIDAAIDALNERMKTSPESRRSLWSDAIARAREIKELGGIKNKGKIYEVELAPKQDEYLLWDELFSDQSEKVKSALKNSIIKNDMILYDRFEHRALASLFDERPRSKSFDPKGHELYEDISDSLESPQAASKYLHSIGIRGIKYLDGLSRSKGEGSYNYVIFSDEDIEITAKFSKAEADYRMEHKSPGREGNAPLSDLTGNGNIYPADVYSNKAAEYYGDGNDKMDRQSFGKARLFRGKPDAMVEIYRAVPKGMTGGINPGDWVTINKAYAKEHGESYFDGEYDILTKKVRAGDVFTNGDSIHEWGYEPKDISKFSRKDVVPETLNINGIDRPTRNSEGRLIHTTEEGIRDFWKRLGNSKIVDEQGRPKVMYHGTNDDFETFDNTKSKKKRHNISNEKASNDSFWFTDKKELAVKFANSGLQGRYLYPGSYVKEVYLKADNVDVVDMKKTTLSRKEREWSHNGFVEIGFRKENTVKQAKDSGRDGVMFLNALDGSVKHSTVIAVFNTNQIIPETGNTVDFSSLDKPEFSFAGQKAETADKSQVPEETRFRKFQRKTQDSFNRFTVIKDWLAERGMNLSEKADVYAAEERSHAKKANQIEDFREQKRNPLIEKIEKAGFTMADVVDFLEAQHAKEANKANRKLTGENDSMAYGISDEEAQEYLDQAPEELKVLANELRSITDDTVKLRIDNGMLTQEEVDAWGYEHYIPVKGTELGNKGTGGKGLGVNFKTKRRLGHGRRDEAVIENIFMDHERAIMQVEDNRVGKHLLMMAAEIGMPELMTIGQPVKRKVLKNSIAYEVQAKGVTQAVFDNIEAAKTFKQMLPAVDKKIAASEIIINPTHDQRIISSASPMLAENEINVYMNGHAIRLQINDEISARAYAKLGIDGYGDIVAAGRMLNGYLSKVYTGYNPEFILTNMMRDFTTGIMNLTGEEGIAMSAKSVANYARSFASLFKYAATNGKSSNKWIDMYRDSGGNTGAAYLSDMERLGNEVATEYASHQGVIANIKQGDMANASRAAGRKVFNVTLKWIYNLNQAGENAMRLAAFRAMIESGRSVNEAAKVAKNITVNFNRKGEWGPELNAAYLFYNASVQGVAATAHALTKGKHKHQAQALAAGMTYLGYAVAAALAGGDEDDYDKINDNTKERNLLIKSGDGYVKIPVPYGYGFFYNLGRVMADAQRKDELGKMPWHVAASAIEELTPFGDIVVGEHEEFRKEQIQLGLLPTAIKIPLQQAFNQHLFSGGEIMPDSQFDQSKPYRERMWRGTQGTLYDQVAGWLSSAGVDVSPESLKYYTRTFTGGAGALADSAVSAAMLKKEGAELDPAERPFLRKVYGELNIRDDRSAYYKARAEAKLAAEEFNRAKSRNDLSSIQKVVNDKQEMLALDKYANKMSEVIKHLRDQQDAIRLSDKFTVTEKRLKIKDLELSESKFYDQYLDVFKTNKIKMKERTEN